MAHSITTPDQCLQALRTFSSQELEHEIKHPRKLLLESINHRDKRLDTVWAPFDYVNPKARIGIVGLTPGQHQMENALRACHTRLQTGASTEQAMLEAKNIASFSGPMRANLVNLLDDIGVAYRLGLGSTAELWEEASDLVQFTSALRYPVFVDGKNYSGQPSMLRQSQLRGQLERWMGEEMRTLPGAIYVPLGPKVGEALAWLGPRVGVSDEQILTGLPHSSGANAERIAYWLKRKAREHLSAKTNPDKLDAARNALIAQLRKREV